MTDLNVSDSPKMLRETLCVAQSTIGLQYPSLDGRSREHIGRLQRLIDECDRHRPLGPDGKHGDRHTETCGCLMEEEVGKLIMFQDGAGTFEFETQAKTEANPSDTKISWDDKGKVNMESNE